MTTDDLFTPLTPATANGGSTRKCRRHIWGSDVHPSVFAFREELGLTPDPTLRCFRCGAPRDLARARRGKSASRMGKDQERAFEREHGPTKIGERGDPVDHLGRLGKYQVKSTRGAVPARLRHITRMDGLYGDRIPVLVERFVHVGRKTETYLTVRLSDWQALHGRDEE